MKLHQLRDIVAIAECGSLRAAARHLDLAQPAVTRSLGELERELGAPLFERQSRGMVPTAIGQAFVRRAAVILNEVRRAREEADQLQGGPRGTVAVGLSIAPHMAMLPAVLRPFRTRYPAVQLRIVEGFYPTLASGLTDGSIDFYVGPETGRPIAPELLQETLFSNMRVILGRRGHPLAGATCLADLADAEWATTSITVEAEEELAELFQQHGLAAPRPTLQSQSALTLIVTLANTDLLAMVPVQWLDFTPTAAILQAIAVKEMLPAPDIVMIRRAALPLTPAATFLIDLIRKRSPEQSGLPAAP